VVVTGLGCLTGLGCDVASIWEGIIAGRSAVGPIRRFDPSDSPVRFAAECPEEIPLGDLSPKEARRLDRCILLALAASERALADARLEAGAVDRDRVGVALGSGIGGIGTLLQNYDVLLSRGPRRVSPFVVPMTIANMASGTVSMRYGFRGPNLCPVGACASGAQAIGHASRIIERGDADVMVAGGSEAAIDKLVVTGFAAMRALSTRNDEPQRASRPFDIGRDGFVIAEGAGLLVLEGLDHARARGARIRAEVLGYGEAADAAHVTSPDQDGGGAKLAMQRALADAGVPPEDVDHVNAHATSTVIGDRVEARAIRELFGAHTEHLPVSATKSMTGHLLGAAGAVEAIFTILALETGILPPTINLDEPDPECQLDHVAHKARSCSTARRALSNAFGFGGISVSLLLGRGEES
jgi:3-oxoacyl-[acyl-carrier-protein] synthase II